MEHNPGDIISGKVIYTIDDFSRDFRIFTDKLTQNGKEYTDKEKLNNFKRFFMLVLLSALDKPSKRISKLLGIPEEYLKDGQELFKREIDVLRAIWMAKYIGVMNSHLVNDGVVLKLLNAEIQSFLKSLFPEEYQHANSA